MKKRKNSPKKKPYKRILPENLSVIKENFIVGLFRKFWKIAIVFSIVVTIVLAIKPIHDLLLSPQERFKQQNFDEGDLEAPAIPAPQSPIESPLNFTIKKFNYKVPPIQGIYIDHIEKKYNLFLNISGDMSNLNIKNLYKGVNIFKYSSMGCSDSNIILAIRDSKLYISLEFKDLQNEQTIGFIEFNHWSIYKPNTFYYKNTNKKLEVRDKQNNIVLALSYSDFMNGSIYLSGYFLNNKSVFIAQSDSLAQFDKYSMPICIYKTNPNWKQDALVRIQKIKSIF